MYSGKIAVPPGGGGLRENFVKNCIFCIQSVLLLPNVTKTFFIFNITLEKNEKDQFVDL
jgi:hypothetical protein